MVFVQNGVGALALTSDAAEDIFARLTHTTADTLEQVAPARLAETALALREFLEEINHK